MVKAEAVWVSMHGHGTNSHSLKILPASDGAPRISAVVGEFISDRKSTGPSAFEQRGGRTERRNIGVRARKFGACLLCREQSRTPRARRPRPREQGKKASRFCRRNGWHDPGN